jgi:hypothetical protein
MLFFYEVYMATHEVLLSSDLMQLLTRALYNVTTTQVPLRLEMDDETDVIFKPSLAAWFERNQWRYQRPDYLESDWDDDDFLPNGDSLSTWDRIKHKFERH